ncbi:MAG: heme exporter protein CcmB [Alphaproteobacteria bacterium]
MWAIARKDLAIERRTGEMLSSLFLLALLVVLVFAFAVEPERLVGPEIAAGLTWATLLFSGTLALNRSFQVEREAGAWTALALLPVDRGSIFLGKMLANFVLLGFAALVLLPAIAILLGTHGLDPSLLTLALSLVLGVLGISAIGTLCSAIASRSRAREVLMPLLAFPLLAPLLIAAAHATTCALVGSTPAEVGSWLAVLLGFDMIFATAGWLAFDWILEE